MRSINFMFQSHGIPFVCIWCQIGFARVIYVGHWCSKLHIGFSRVPYCEQPGSSVAYGAILYFERLLYFGCWCSILHIGFSRVPYCTLRSARKFGCMGCHIYMDFLRVLYIGCWCSKLHIGFPRVPYCMVWLHGVPYCCQMGSGSTGCFRCPAWVVLAGRESLAMSNMGEACVFCLFFLLFCLCACYFVFLFVILLVCLLFCYFVLLFIILQWAMCLSLCACYFACYSVCVLVILPVCLLFCLCACYFAAATE